MTEAWYFAALAASASVGKLPSLDHLLGGDSVEPAKAIKPVKPKSNGKDQVAADLLGFMFKMRSIGVPMTIERVERLH